MNVIDTILVRLITLVLLFTIFDKFIVNYVFQKKPDYEYRLHH